MNGRYVVRCIVICSLTVLAACAGSDSASREDPRIAEGRALYDRAEFDRAGRFFLDLRETAAGEADHLLEAQAEKWLGSVRLAYAQADEA
ncbi:MAG: hypothetical protein KFF77_07955, partial [Bacteroidetes bacterium]|nr:hypothetical protein [Bacteroidota bacterium]